MKNSDMPAMPISEIQGSDIDMAISSPKSYGLPTGLGLTKREYFAGLAMQALVSTEITGKASAFAEDSILMADALLAELDKRR